MFFFSLSFSQSLTLFPLQSYIEFRADGFHCIVRIISAAFQQLHCSKTDDLRATGKRGCVAVFTSRIYSFVELVFFFSFLSLSHPYIKQIHSHYSLCSKRLYRSRRRFNFLIKNNILPLYIVIITEREVQFHHKESIIIIIIIIIVGSGCCRRFHRSGVLVYFILFYFFPFQLSLSLSLSVSSISLLFVCFSFGISVFFFLSLCLFY